MPGGHRLHSVDPSSSVKVPGRQKVHEPDVDPGEYGYQYDPRVQGTHRMSLQTDPGLQLQFSVGGLVGGLVGYWNMQLMPSIEYAVSGQRSQNALPGIATELPGQGKHFVDPTMLLTVPLLQGMHDPNSS